MSIKIPDLIEIGRGDSNIYKGKAETRTQNNNEKQKQSWKTYSISRLTL